jgi:DNA polymerase III epsilon subunit family exonuclease
MRWELDENQKQAVESPEKSIMVVAGPGTGKTRVLTARAQYLIESQGVDPSRIIAITYTNRAAAEMRTRIASSNREQTEFGVGNPSGISEISVSTFHSWAFRLVREHHKILGFTREPVVYDDEASEQFIRLILGRKRIPEEVFPVRNIKNTLDSVKSMIACPVGNRRVDPEFTEQVYDLFRAYQEELTLRNALDFNDILLNALRLFFLHTDIKDEIAGKIDHLLIDEFQDINSIQYMLVKEIYREGMNLFAVGDEDQTIYGFRGSSGEYIDRFVSDFNGVLIPLGTSYRCSNEILYAAGSLIGNNRRHYQIPPRAAKNIKENPPVAIYEMEDEDEESRLVAKQLRAWAEAGCAYRDMAVLYRIHNLADDCERELINSGIPVQRLGNDPHRKEIPGDPTPFLRLAVADSEWDWEKAIGIPRERLGELDDLRLRLEAQRKNEKLDKIISKPSSFKHLSALARNQLSEINRFVKKLRKMTESDAPSMIVNEVSSHIAENTPAFLPVEDDWIRKKELEISGFDEFTPGAILEQWGKSKDGIRIFHAPTITSLISANMLQRACEKILKIKSEVIPFPFNANEKAKYPVDDRPACVIGLNLRQAGLFPESTLVSQVLYIYPGSVAFSPVEVQGQQENFAIALTTHRVISELTGFRPGGAKGEQIIFFDLETTGTDIFNSEIVEIAAVAVHLRDGDIRESGEFHSLVKPMNPIPAGASNVHGIKDDDVKDAPSIKEILPKFIEFIGDHPLSGHNIEKFDLPILRRWCGIHLKDTIPNLFIDTYPMSTRLFPGEPHRLEVLAEKLAVKHGQAHRALDDVRMNIGIFKKMLVIDESRRARSFSSEVALELGVAMFLDDDYSGESEHLKNAAGRYISSVGSEVAEIPFVKSLRESLTKQAWTRLVNIVTDLSRHVVEEEELNVRIRSRVEFMRDEALKLEDENSDVSITELLAHISLLTESDFESDEDAVRMMTLHAAKGLEFDRVLIIGMEHGTLPHRLALNKTVEEIEEERRLLYVGLTRARDKVGLSYVRHRNGMWRGPSMFIREIPRNAVKKLKSRRKISEN